MKFNKMKKYAVQAVMSIAYILTIVCVNSACVGPSYQPELPNAAEKFRREYK